MFDRLLAFLGISGTPDDTTLMEDCIDRTTALFEAMTNRNLKARGYSYLSTSNDYDPDNAVFDGNDRDKLVLPQYPINSVTTLRINTIEIAVRGDVFDTGYVIDKKRGILMLAGYLFTSGLRNIEVVYNAGYSTIPEDLEHACIEQAAWMFRQATPGGGLLGVAGKTLADGSISFTARDILPQVQLVLNHYKRRFVL